MDAAAAAVAPVILDGGLSTELERRGADLRDRLWSARLLLDDPDLIGQVHRAYFDAGAQVAITATYQASAEGFATRGIDAAAADDLLRLAVGLAREARDAAAAPATDRPRLLVAASLGPFGATLADGSEYTGDYGDTDVDALIRFHRPRTRVLVDAGPDLLAAETIPSLDETRALAAVLSEIPDTPAWVSFSCRDGAHLSDGTPIEEAAAVAASVPSVVAVGVNCTPGRFISPLLQRLRDASPLPAVIYPNAGWHWNATDRVWTDEDSSTPEDLAAAAQDWRKQGAAWIGGCCGFGVDAIEALARSAG